MSKIKIDKVVSALPTVLEPNTMYAVRVGTGFDLFMSDSTGTSAHALNASTGSPTAPTITAESVAAVAAGSTLGSEQRLLAAQGQVGQTILAVGHVYHQGDAQGTSELKAQISSLNSGNVVFVYATGPDFNAGIIQEGPIFLGDGEVYVIENLRNGSIITATEGAYGFSQQRNGSQMSPMPLLSLALAITDTFAFIFRNAGTNDGRIWGVNGPLASVLRMTTGTGAVVLGQENIQLDPYDWFELNTDGNGEYRLESTNPVMLCTAARMLSNVFADSRLILPLSNDIVGWPRSGFVSALYPNTVADYYVNDGPTGQFTASPGAPVDYAGVTGAQDTDYEPRGATRSRAAGLVSGFSGADSAGLEATPQCPVSTFTQRIALPLKVRANAGDGGNNGIALAAIYTGTATLWEWDPVTRTKRQVTVNDPDGNPVTEIPLIRRNGSNDEYIATTPQEQLHPSSCTISTGDIDAVAGAHYLTEDFLGGYIEVNVPAMCAFNSEQNQNQTVDTFFRGTSGPSVGGIFANDDEQLSYGITPDVIRAEIRQGLDGMRYRRDIGAGGADTWGLG